MTNKMLVFGLMALLLITIVTAEPNTTPTPTVEEEYVDEYCGDGTCNNGETCSSCEVDCGICEEEDDYQESDGDDDDNTGGSNACYTDWVCSDWSACENDKQTRTCSKKVARCFTNEDKPSETKDCSTQQDTPNPTSTPMPNEPTDNTWIYVVIGLVLIAVTVFFYLANRQRREEEYEEETEVKK